MGDARRPPREQRPPLVDYKWSRSLSERVRGMKDGPLGRSWRGRRDRKLQGKTYRPWILLYSQNLSSRDTSISQRKCSYMTGVSTWRVSLHDGCPYMTGVSTWQVSLYDRCLYMTGDPSWQVFLYDGCPYMTGSLYDRCLYLTGVPIWQVSLFDRCPYMTGAPIWQVSLYDRCPYMTGVSTWQIPIFAGSFTWER